MKKLFILFFLSLSLNLFADSGLLELEKGTSSFWTIDVGALPITRFGSLVSQIGLDSELPRLPAAMQFDLGGYGAQKDPLNGAGGLGATLSFESNFRNEMEPFVGVGVMGGIGNIGGQFTGGFDLFGVNTKLGYRLNYQESLKLEFYAGYLSLINADSLTNGSGFNIGITLGISTKLLDYLLKG